MTTLSFGYINFLLMKGLYMSKSENTKLNATPLVENVEFIEGVSQKTGNAFLVGALYLKSPISETPIRIAFDYLDDNTRALIKMAIKKYGDAQVDDFKKGIED